MTFVIFHGAFGGPEENWFPELKEKLESLGQKVLVPKFPVDSWENVTRDGPQKAPQNQSLKSWFKIFDRAYKSLKESEKLCFIGHSLGPVFILHIVDKYNIQLDSAIFVSPFMNKLKKDWQFDHVNKSFYKTDFDFKKLKKLIPISYVLYSDNDPYVEKRHPLDFAKKLGSSIIFVKRAGHMNNEANLNEFPLVFELSKTRLDLSLYQKYLAHRKELYAVDYTKSENEEVIYLKPEEIFDEGRFKFKNLKKEGFCTFYTALSLWNTQSVYMKEARQAAKRIKKLTRVFIVNKVSDLKRKLLLEQIRLDVKAGIEVHLVMLQDIKDLGCELDFGIWDDDYLCTVEIDKWNQVVGVRLSSRKIDIQKAQGWKKKIFKKAVRIYNAKEDIEKFVQRHKN